MKEDKKKEIKYGNRIKDFKDDERRFLVLYSIENVMLSMCIGSSDQCLGCGPCWGRSIFKRKEKRWNIE